MRFALAALFLLAAAPVAAQRIPVQGLPGAALDGRGGRTVLRLPGHGRTAVLLGRDGPCGPCTLQEARLVGKQPGAALILLLTYASRTGMPGGMCGAGQEEVLHAVRLRPHPHEAVALRLHSCWNTIEAMGSPSWDAQRGLLAAERQTPESGSAPERRAWHIGRDGRVAAVTPPQAAR